jgi:hypothetical protein
MMSKVYFGKSWNKKALGLLISSIVLFGAFSPLVTVSACGAAATFSEADVSDDRSIDDSATSDEDLGLIEKGGQGVQLTPPIVTPGGNSLTVKGQFVIDPSGPAAEEPIQFATVTLWEEEGPEGSLFPVSHYVAKTYTDEFGNYSFTVPWKLYEWGEKGNFRVIAGAKNYAAEVWDNPEWIPDWWPGNDGVIYGFGTNQVRDVPDHSIVNMGKLLAPEHDWGAFHIINTLTEGWDFLNQATGYAEPKHVNVFWGDRFIKDRSYYYPDSTPTDPGTWSWLKTKAAAVAGFFLDLAGVLDSIVGIHVQDDTLDEWNDALLLEEYGHYIMDKYASIWPPDSWTNHSYDAVTDEANAWVEGWAAYFSSAVRRWAIDPSINLEEPNLSGSNVEGAVAGMLWDMYDGYDHSEPDDFARAQAFSRIFHVLREHVGTIDYGWFHFDEHISSVCQFRDLYLSHYPEDRYPLWSVFNLHGVAQPDHTPPTNPTSYDFSHTPNDWERSWGARIRVRLLDQGTDDPSGVKGYFYFWDNEPPESARSPDFGDSFLSTFEAPVIISPDLTMGVDWWLHLRTVDYANNWASETYHAGPFQVRIEPDDDTTGPTLSNPVAFISEKDWALKNGEWVRGSFLFLTLGIDAVDASGISSIKFRGNLYGTPLESSSFSNPLGNTYYSTIQFTGPWNYHEKPPIGSQIDFEVLAYDNDSEGWEDKAWTLESFAHVQLQETPPYQDPLSLSCLNVTLANWPLNLLITAPNGLRFGRDLGTGLNVSEIYPAFVYWSESEQFLIPAPIEGEYTIEVLGMEAGPCSIFMEYVAANGTIMSSASLIGTIKPGKPKTQRIELDADGTITDSSPPTLSATLAGSLGLNDWYVSDINVTITATDDMSGVAMTEFSLDGQNWTAYTEPLTISTEGTTTVYYQATDNSENNDETSSEMRIDKSPSTLGDLLDGVATQGEIEFQTEAIDKVSGTSSVNLTIYDEYGNLIGTEDMPASEDPATGYWNLTLAVTRPTNGYKTVVVETMDEAGNLASKTFAGRIAVKNVAASKTVVGSGYETSINVTAHSQGGFYLAPVTLYATAETANIGLRGYWGFDEGSGTIAHDTSGYSSHGNFPLEKAWEWQIAGNFEGWTASSDVVNLQCDGTSLRGTTTGGNPNIDSPGSLAIDASNAKTIHFRMNTTNVSTPGRIYFITAADTLWNSDKSIFFSLRDAGQWTEYNVDMSGIQGWNGTITQIKFVPCQTSGTTFRVDWLRIGGNPTWIDGRFGSALDFDGVDDKVQASFIPFNDQSFTITAWFNARSLPSFPVDAPILSQFDNPSTDKYLHVVLRSSHVHFGFYGDDLTGTTTIDEDTWYHIACVYNSSSNRKSIYVNGELDAEGPSGSAYNGMSGLTEIGFYSGCFFNGTLDEVRIYNKALTKENIKAAANSGAIQTQQVFLPSWGSVNVTFTWATSGWARGNYTISAYAWPVQNETVLADNAFVGGWVSMSIPGDVVEPYRLVDIFDVVAITGIYESELGDPEYMANSDIDGNGIVDIFDVVACTSHYDESW